ncbi:MAG: MBL fold metallo-hydrolase, partial [Chloroflexota bacterium]|nr:MBL fold metallo-hydrolase [Chloroflexota bacterium]
DIEHLPPLDLVVLSHMHEDHFDRVAEQKLDKSVPIITTEHAAASLKKSGFRSPIALSTWGSIAITKGDVTLRITSMPGRHGPGPLTAALPPVMGSMLEWIRLGSTEPLFKLYITGDTLMFSDLKRIPELFPNIDLVLLHLGGTRVMGLMLTMDDKQGVQMLKLVRPKMAIPVHFNDYTVFKSPLRDFVRAVKEAGLQGKVRYLKHGDIHHFQVAHTAPVGGTSRNTDAGTTDKSPNAIP